MLPTKITNDIPLLGDIIRSGGVVIFPTETVYGMGASSINREACLKIYQTKGRPSDNPLIAHFESIAQIQIYCEIPRKAMLLLETFTPGPLTLILKKKNDAIFPFGMPTLAVRIPGHKGALELIRASLNPISAPSANPSGKPSFTRESDVIDFYKGKVDGILIGEAPTIGIESTVLDMTGGIGILLRPGKITAEDLSLFIPDLIHSYGSTKLISSDTPKSPGLKYRHYSPNANVELLKRSVFLERLKTCNTGEKIAFIGFDYPPKLSTDLVLNSNLEYMQSLYSFFIDADKERLRICVCEEPKKDQYFAALVNRLQKAASKI